MQCNSLPSSSSFLFRIGRAAVLISEIGVCTVVDSNPILFFAAASWLAEWLLLKRLLNFLSGMLPVVVLVTLPARRQCVQVRSHSR